MIIGHHPLMAAGIGRSSTLYGPSVGRTESMMFKNISSCTTVVSVSPSSFRRSSTLYGASAGGTKRVWLRVPVVQNLKKACRLPVRVQKQQENDGFYSK